MEALAIGIAAAILGPPSASATMLESPTLSAIAFSSVRPYWGGRSATVASRRQRARKAAGKSGELPSARPATPPSRTPDSRKRVASRSA